MSDRHHRQMFPLRLAPEDRALLDAFAERHGISRNAAVVEFVRAGAHLAEPAEDHPA